MAVILKEEINGAPAYFMGPGCRRGRPGIDPPRRLRSVAEADDWPQAALGAPEAQRLN